MASLSKKTSVNEPSVVSFTSFENLGTLVDFGKTAQKNITEGRPPLSRDLIRHGFRHKVLQNVEHFQSNERAYHSWCNSKYNVESVGLSSFEMQVGVEGILSTIKDKFKAIKSRIFKQSEEFNDSVNENVSEQEAKASKLKASIDNVDDTQLEKPKKVVSYKKIALVVTGAVALAGLVTVIILNWKKIASGDIGFLKSLKAQWNKLPFFGSKEAAAFAAKKARVNNLRKDRSRLEELSVKFEGNPVLKKYLEETEAGTPKKLGWTKSALSAIYGKVTGMFGFLKKAPANMYAAIKNWSSSAEKESTVFAKASTGPNDGKTEGDYQKSLRQLDRASRESLSMGVNFEEYEDEALSTSQRFGIVFRMLRFVWSGIKACLRVVGKTLLVIATIVGVAGAGFAVATSKMR